MERLEATTGLFVRQHKELAEVLTGFETRNRYLVMDQVGSPLYHAEEEGSILLRWTLRALRPFTILVRDPEGGLRFRLTRPFRFWFHRIEVYDGGGSHLGSIQRRFSLFRRIYAILDATGNEVLRLFGPVLHPWTFQIHKGEEVIGKITKRWSGLLKEGFTDADHFGVIYPAEMPGAWKALCLGAVFLIDFVHFENPR